ncbi:MAG: class I SAM-dependent methyltransferase [Saprospiraceae bacterium]|nr:class I SAM-dependent methyltransferase [Saprospiraceae bacterium]
MQVPNYSAEIARHYLAYRPPLHALILEKCLKGKRIFQYGLDIGAGTGQSTIALSKYCLKVTGLEPSLDMLAQAIQKAGVSYKQYDGKKIPFRDDLFDIITFAGSLNYAKSQRTLDEVIRVSSDSALIIIYDFEIKLDQIFDHIGYPPVEAYDHRADFEDLDSTRIYKQDGSVASIAFKVSPADLAHLILSEQSSFRFFSTKYEQDDPYPPLLEHLLVSESDPVTLTATLFITLYQLIV